MNLFIGWLRSKATLSSLSFRERAGLRVIECCFTSAWLYNNNKTPPTGNKSLAILLAIVLAIMADSVYAQAACSVSTSGLSFGEYDVFSLADNNSVGYLSVSCTGITESTNVAYEILLSRGFGAYALRTMMSESNPLAYNLYTQANYSIIWGDGSPGTSVIADSYGLGQNTISNQYPIYGRIPAGQNINIGSYRDILIVTVNY